MILLEFLQRKLVCHLFVICVTMTNMFAIWHIGNTQWPDAVQKLNRVPTPVRIGHHAKVEHFLHLCRPGK